MRTRLGFLVGFLIGVVLVVYFSEQTRQNLLSGCERGNGRNLVAKDLADSLIDVNKRRIKASSSPAEAKANRYALQRYRANLAELVDSVADVAARPGGVKVDCDAAYPPSIPLSWFQ